MLNSPREVIRNGSKSFSLASLFLPRANRSEIYTLYAWFRYCDDLIDASGSQLSDLSNLKDQTFKNHQNLDFTDFQKLVAAKNLQTFYFDEFFEGLRMDLENKGYESLKDLELYCYRVAGVVGLIMCPLIGVTHPLALRHACALGIAMQLTNICRDVREDAQNNRIYLPRQLLQTELTPQQLFKSPELGHSAILHLLDRAEALYRYGNQGLQYLPFREALAIGSASHIYREIGLEILKSGPKSYRKRVVIGRARKIKCIVFGFFAVIASRLQTGKDLKSHQSLQILPFDQFQV